MADMRILLFDQFVQTRIGEPFRLFPFGTLHKNGQTIELTPELAKTFKLPHFKPAIKLGGHDDTLPAGGHIVGLEVRVDGVYAIPEWNENGTTALEDGSYRYHSPEILWEGGLLDSTTGEEIPAPIILGDALLHNPALGEAVAFFTVDNAETKRGEPMSEMTQVPTPLWNRILAMFEGAFNKPEPDAEPTPPDTSHFEAEITQQREKLAAYEAQIATLEAEKSHAAKVAHFGTELAEWPATSGDSELHEILAKLPEELADKLLTKFKAMGEQIKESNLTGDIGGDADEPLGPEGIVTLAQKYAAENNVSYTDAVQQLAKDRPELWEVR